MPREFLAGDPFYQGIFHWQLMYCIGDFQRRRHGLIWEGAFEKGVPNPGAVAPGALAPGPFGSGCVVLCEISKQSKCVETIPYVKKSICHIDKNLCTGSGCTVPCEISKCSKCVETKIFFLIHLP